MLVWQAQPLCRKMWKGCTDETKVYAGKMLLVVPFSFSFFNYCSRCYLLVLSSYSNQENDEFIFDESYGRSPSPPQPISNNM